MEGAAALQKATGLALLGALEQQEVGTFFEKRHPIAHNLGVVDRQYLKKVQGGVLEGRELRVTVHEVERAIARSSRVLNDVYGQASGSAG